MCLRTAGLAALYRRRLAVALNHPIAIVSQLLLRSAGVKQVRRSADRP